MTVYDMLKRNEGVRYRVYKDSLGIETIGVGFNLRRPDAPSRCAKRGVDYKALLSGAVQLTEAQVDSLLHEDVAACIESVRAIVPGFAAMPEAAQFVLIDMRFQLGEAGLKAFRNTLSAFRAQDWKKAAAGLRASLAYKQTTKRWERNAQALESIKP